MTEILLIVLGSIAAILVRTIVNHSLAVAAVLVVHGPAWILACVLALPGAPAIAVPCEDEGSPERDGSSIRLEPTQALERSYDASRTLGDELSPVRRRHDPLPQGLRDDGRALDWRTRIAGS